MKALPLIDYDSHPAYQDLREGDEDLRRRVQESFEPQLELKRRSLTENIDVYQSRASGSADSFIDVLARDGASAMRLADGDVAELKRVFQPLNERLEQRIGDIRSEGKRLKFPDTEALVRQNGEVLPGMEDIAAAAVRVIERAGVIQIAEGYYEGYGAKLWNIVFRRNVADQDFFQARGQETSRTAGMHIDSNSRPVMNGIIYLNDVGIDQGPFKYVIGSNHWAFDAEDRAIRKAVDEAGFGSGGGRKFFVQLPPEHRRKASFGYDIADDTPLSRDLLERERPFTSETTDLVLFDSDGVHRGGDVRQGARLSILFSAKIIPPAKRKKKLAA